MRKHAGADNGSGPSEENRKHRQRLIRRTGLLVRSSGKKAQDISFVLQESDEGRCLY